MAAIKRLKDEKDEKIKEINSKIEKESHTENKKNLLNLKEQLLNQKLELSNMLIKFNRIKDEKDSNIMNEKIYLIKRKSDNFEENFHSIKEEEVFMIKKDLKRNRKTKKIKKCKNNIIEDEKENSVDILSEENSKSEEDNISEELKKTEPNNISSKNSIDSEKSNEDNNYKVPKKNINKSNKKDKKFKKIKNKNIIDKFTIEKNYNFSKYNINYSWLNEEYITEFTRKKESNKWIYLVCTKRGRIKNPCPGKAKYEKATGIIYVYEKCKNTNNNHKSIDSEKFNEMYRQNTFNNINMKNIIYQKFLVSDNRIHDYTDCQEKFKSLFPNIKFKITIDIYKKLKIEY